MLNLFDIHVVFSDIAELVKYVPITLALTLASGVLGLILGFVMAIIRIKRMPILYQMIGVFISFMRGTPIIVQLYVTYFGIPILLKYINYYQNMDLQNINVPSIVYAIVALALNNAAFSSVIIQSSFESVNPGEIEAATALGMTGSQRMFRIIIPEAIELALPNMGNQWIGLVKGTSLAFTCAVVEMTSAGKIIGARGYRYFEAYVALAVLYWLITIVLEQIIKLILHLVKVPDIVSGGKAERKALKRKKLQKAQGGMLQ